MFVVHVIKYENNNKYRQIPKIMQKSVRRKCRSRLNRNFFSKRIIYNPLKIFSEQAGNIIFGIIW